MKALLFSDSVVQGNQTVSYLRGKMEVGVAVPSELGEKFASSGARRIYSLTGTLSSGNVAEKLSELFKTGYDYAFVDSTILGREVAGYMAAVMGSTCIGEINSFEVAGGKVRTKRFFYGGKTVLEEESSSKLFTVAPGISEASAASGKAEVEEIVLQEPNVTVEKSENKASTGVDISSAKILVSIGRGLGKKEGLQQIEPLARALNAEFAGSRPVCLDYQWLGEDRWVGISGKKVSPKVYLALGISGQIQHIAGIRGSKVIIAINKDKSAPIFEECDYGIVGDMYQVVPKILGLLK
ncbi:electron transfer flavoprotein subunit YdiR [Thermoplasmatales archaeon]|nr:electron transfer flavoprotein subunit YdiR [Thermoplasmatales archaeon]